MARRGRAGWRWVTHVHTTASTSTWLNTISSWHPDEVTLVLNQVVNTLLSECDRMLSLHDCEDWTLACQPSHHCTFLENAAMKKWYFAFISTPTLLTYVACILADLPIRRKRTVAWQINKVSWPETTFRPLFASTFNWQPVTCCNISKPIRILNETSGHFPAVFAETKPSILSQSMMFSWS